MGQWCINTVGPPVPFWWPVGDCPGNSKSAPQQPNTPGQEAGQVAGGLGDLIPATLKSGSTWKHVGLLIAGGVLVVLGLAAMLFGHEGGAVNTQTGGVV